MNLRGRLRVKHDKDRNTELQKSICAATDTALQQLVRVKVVTIRCSLGESVSQQFSVLPPDGWNTHNLNCMDLPAPGHCEAPPTLGSHSCSKAILKS